MSRVSTEQRYLRKGSDGRILGDRRRLWASEDREFIPWNSLSGGEQKRRLRFARLITGQRAPIQAIRAALDLDEGPIPGFETQEEFDDYWTTDRLANIANQWLRSPYFLGYAKTQVRAAHNRIGAAAQVAADTLVEICTSPDASPAVRVKASQVILGGVGIVAGSEIAEDVGNEKESLRKAARATLTLVPKPAAEGGQ